MLTVREAAARCCVCESVVRSWIAGGLLPHLRVGAKGRRGKILIQAEDLDGLLASFKVGAKQPEKPRERRPKEPPMRHLTL